MPKLGPVKGRILARVLRRNGLVEVPKRGKGNDKWYVHPDDPQRNTSIPGHNEIKRGTLRSILRNVDKSIEEYQQRLEEL